MSSTFIEGIDNRSESYNDLNTKTKIADIACYYCGRHIRYSPNAIDFFCREFCSIKHEMLWKLGGGNGR